MESIKGKNKKKLTGERIVDFQKEQAIQELVPLLREMPAKFITYLRGVVVDYCQQSQNPDDKVGPSEEKRRKALLSIISKLLARKSTVMLEGIYDILTGNYQSETLRAIS